MSNIPGNGQLPHELRSIDDFLADAICTELWFTYLIWHWILLFGTHLRLHFGERMPTCSVDLYYEDRTPHLYVDDGHLC